MTTALWHLPQKPLILASQSQARQALLKQAAISYTALPASIDEELIRQSAQAEGASADEIAVLLAELKGQKIASSHPEAMVIASDQLLVCEDQIYGKPETLDSAKSQLMALSGKRHTLVTAVMLFDNGKRIWHHIARPEVTFHHLTETEIDQYLAHIQEDALVSPGSYFLEGAGIHLFADLFGDYYAILGLPLLALLPQLKLHGLTYGLQV